MSNVFFKDAHKVLFCSYSKVPQYSTMKQNMAECNFSLFMGFNPPNTPSSISITHSIMSLQI